MSKKRPPGRAGRSSKKTDDASGAKDHKVTARFSDEEFERLASLSDKRGEKLSSLVRGLVLETIEEVEDSIDKRKR